MLIQLGKWQIEVDPDATRKAYSQVESGGAERCGCLYCRNFASARTQAYPPKAVELFMQCGVDPSKELEAYHMGPVGPRAPSLQLYGGWFSLVGKVTAIREPELKRKSIVEDAGFEQIGENFSIGVTDSAPQAPIPFRGLPVVILEFNAKVPWVLLEPFVDWA